jgi:type VI secretion system VasD/TssJ family lipoprotein
MTKVYARITRLYRPLYSGPRARSAGRLVRALCLCLLLAACGGSQPPPPPEEPPLQSEDPAKIRWPRAEKAIQLDFTADRDLNVYDAKAHSLQLCVYQLDKPDAFADQAKSPEGIAALLQCAAFDKSVKHTTRLFLQPLESAASILDRAEGARYLAVVCGYFEAKPEDSAKIWEFKPKETTSGSLFWKSTLYSAGELALHLRLTAHALQEAEEAQAPKE